MITCDARELVWTTQGAVHLRWIPSVRMADDLARVRRAQALMQAIADSERREILDDDRNLEDQAQRFEAAVQRARSEGVDR